MPDATQPLQRQANVARRPAPDLLRALKGAPSSSSELKDHYFLLTVGDSKFERFATADA